MVDKNVGFGGAHSFFTQQIDDADRYNAKHVPPVRPLLHKYDGERLAGGRCEASRG